VSQAGYGPGGYYQFSNLELRLKIPVSLSILMIFFCHSYAISKISKAKEQVKLPAVLCAGVDVTLDGAILQ